MALQTQKFSEQEALLATTAIPCHIFTSSLSPLQTVVKFLHENQSMRLATIARVLNRKVTAVWLAYKHAAQKQPYVFQELPSIYEIPLREFHNKQFGILEAACVFLRDKQHLRFHDIGMLLQRDDRTIWTTYQRARKKLQAEVGFR